MKSIEDHLIEELVDLEYDVLDTLTRLIDRIKYITEELNKIKQRSNNEKENIHIWSKAIYILWD